MMKCLSCLLKPRTDTVAQVKKHQFLYSILKVGEEKAKEN